MMSNDTNEFINEIGKLEVNITVDQEAMDAQINDYKSKMDELEAYITKFNEENEFLYVAYDVDVDYDGFVKRLSSYVKYVSPFFK